MLKITPLDEIRSVLLHNHKSPKSLSINEKKDVIIKIIEMTSNDPLQGTKEWAERREIGGSDTSSVIGQGYYGKCFFDVVWEKIFGSNFSGNFATRFGRVMEEATRKFIERLFDTIVWELKSLPNQLQHTSYSPDGVTILSIRNKMLMVLLEFKTPLSRIPSGKIPKEYLPQIKAGMSAIPMVDGALFVNTMLRICSLEDMKYNMDYNIDIHKADLKKPKDKPSYILAYGIIVISQRPEQHEKASIEFKETRLIEKKILLQERIDYKEALDNYKRKEQLKNVFYSHLAQNGFKSPMMSEYSTVAPELKTEIYSELLLNSNEFDIGRENEISTNIIFNFIDKGYLSAFHIPPYIVVDNLDRIEILGIPKGQLNEKLVTSEVQIYFNEAVECVRSQIKDHVVGLIPYKIFKMDMIYVENEEPEFIQTLKPYIEKYTEIKAQCKEIDNMNIPIEEKNTCKKQVLYKYFPEKKDDTNQISESMQAVLNEDTMF
jgi:hypothetical protein